VEQCDDGNNINGDGCNSNCAVEKEEIERVVKNIDTITISPLVHRAPKVVVPVLDQIDTMLIQTIQQQQEIIQEEHSEHNVPLTITRSIEPFALPLIIPETGSELLCIIS